MTLTKQSARDRKRKKIRAKISGTSECPRLSVFKSNTAIYAQLIDDIAGITDESGKILVQKRSRDKKTFPSHWDIGVAETVQSGEGYEGAAMRGLNEELGILGVSNIQLIHSFLFKIRFESQETREHCKVYKIQYNGDINFQKEEIEETDFLTTSEINDIILKNSFHPVGKMAFEKYLQLISTKK